MADRRIDRKEEKKCIGKVWLAGAGPGDAGLLTVKTRRIMKEADVIVFDALVSTEILSLIPLGKELIDVGKRQGNHSVPQSEINRILLDKAGEGKKVLRLKGGDPFVFGRGGEEAEALQGEGIPFEVVPGVTSAVSVPAYAGIPVTHREFVSSFHVITGHPRKDGSSRIDYKSLVSYGGTLIFLMGITSLGTIVKGLMEAGMNPETKAAVVEKGTTAGQKQVISTLDKLEAEVEKCRIGTPALIVVGEICGLSEKFNWKSIRPLDGKQIIVTRPGNNHGNLAEDLRMLGAQVIEMPTIRTKPISPNENLKTALMDMDSRQKEEWLVFTSVIGVRTFFEELRNLRIDLRTLFGKGGRLKIAAIGAATERELAVRGIFADAVPEVYTAEHLGKCIAGIAETGSFVTIVRAENGSKELVPPLLKKGLRVRDIPLYSTEYEENEIITNRVKNLLTQGEIDYITFTSGSTVKGFVNALKDAEIEKVCAVCIGKQTQKEAERLFGHPDDLDHEAVNVRYLTAAEATEEGILLAICEDSGR